MIQKHIAFFWLGPMSWMRYLTLWSFREHHPDWIIDLYTCKDYPVNPRTWTVSNTEGDYDGVDYWESIGSLDVSVIQFEPPRPGLPPAHICDIFQWWWLSTHSGYYADMDILWLRALDQIHRQVERCDAILCLQKSAMSIGFIGSNHCPIFHRFLEQTEKPGGGYQHYGVDLIHKIFQSRSAIKHMRKQYPGQNIHAIRDECIYPLRWNQVDQIFDAVVPIPGTFGLHWFGGSPIARAWENRLTETEWHLHRSTFTECLNSLVRPSVA